MIRTYMHYIDGKWINTTSGKTYKRECPANGNLVAEYPLGTRDEALAAIAAARKAFDKGLWPKMSGAKRAEFLFKYAEAIEKEKDKLARIECEDVGKPIREAIGEMQACADFCRHAAGLALNSHGEAYNNMGEDYVAMIVREPKGVIGMITPWNFPACTLFQKLPLALAAGCTAVIKPCSFTSGTTLELARIAHECGIPAGVINVVTGSGSLVGNTIVESKNVDMISFTGSTEVGTKIIEKTAKNCTRVGMELGGKSAMIVFNDCDMDDAIDGAMIGAFINQGEECVATSRLLLEESIADEFVKKLAERTGKIRFGDIFDPETQMGALIHEEHMNSVLDYIRIGKEEGAQLVCGGNRMTGGIYDKGFFVAPTIFDHVTPDMCIYKEEIFGPVLSVTRFKTKEEAIELANDSIYGLGGGVWTKDIDIAMEVARAVRAGTMWVNTCIDGTVLTTFGGYKMSGIGREKGNAGFDEFTEVKTIQIHLGKRNPFYK